MTLARNAAFNFLGAAAPAVLSVLTIPFIVHKLGPADYGLLALVTAIVGYFSLVDVNVTAGSTKYVSEFSAQGDRVRLGQTICFGLAVYAAIGLLGMLCLWLSAETLVTRVFTVPLDRQAAAVAAVEAAAIGFAFGQMQAYLQSLPGAVMRFDVSGRMEAMFGIAVPVLTVAMLQAGFGLVAVVWLRVVMSAVQAAAVAVVVLRLLPGFVVSWPNATLRRDLMSFSLYSFLSRIAAVTYAHADKLVIGARVGVSALTFFVVPQTLAGRVMGLLFRFSGVMFPHASAMAATDRLPDLRRHYLTATRYMFFANGALALTLAGLAHPILRQWLGVEFADAGTSVMTLVVLTLWLDSLTNLPSLVNDGLGHPKVTGWFSLIRVFLGLGLVYAGASYFSIEGAAAGHLTAAVLTTGVFLFYVHERTVPAPFALVIKESYAGPVAALLPLGTMTWLLAQYADRGWPELICVLGFLATGYAVAGWSMVLLPDHRNALAQAMRARFAH